MGVLKYMMVSLRQVTYLHDLRKHEVKTVGHLPNDKSRVVTQVTSTIKTHFWSIISGTDMVVRGYAPTYNLPNITKETGRAGVGGQH